MADGKRALVAPPVGDEDDAQMVTTIQESRWLAGVTRQAQPTRDAAAASAGRVAGRSCQTKGASILHGSRSEA